MTGYLQRSYQRIITEFNSSIGDSDMALVALAFIVGILVGVVLF